MGIKKIARPMNKAKNAFVKWLKKNKATDIDIYYSNDNHNDYHCHVSAFIGNIEYSIHFVITYGVEYITYNSSTYYRECDTTEEFISIIGR